MTDSIGESDNSVTTPGGPQSVDATIRSKFGYMAWALDEPEIGPLLRQAATEDWDEATFRGALYQTQWWQTYSQPMREFDRLVSEDNAQAASLITAKRLELRVASARLGLTLSGNDEYRISVDALKFGWNESQLQSALAGQISIAEGKPQVSPASTVGAYTSMLDQLESDYMVHISPDSKADMIRRYAEGTIDEASTRNFFLVQAKSRRPYLADQLDSGITTKNYFSPYVEQTAKLLEVSPSEVDLLNNPKYARMTEMADENGKIRPMTLYEAGRYVRGLDDYRKTDQAHAEGATVNEAILKTFGKVA